MTMDKTLILFCCLAISCIVARPASNEQLDKFPKSAVWTMEEWKRRLYLRQYSATVNDIAANSVSPADTTVINGQNNDGVSVEITGAGASTDAPTPFKPQKSGSMFARLIDDIFQIPITVLQNVAKLITGPFMQNKKTPEVPALA